MTRTNHPNPQTTRQFAIVELLHDRRGFFPTDRQRQLYTTLLGTPSPDSIVEQPQGQAAVPPVHSSRLFCQLDLRSPQRSLR